MQIKLEERFRSKHAFGGSDDCWNWQAATNNNGYGVFHSKTERLAHRMAYTLYVGPIPPGAVVRHACDNPLCVNPRHLLLGTQAENMQDAIDRGRFPRGDDHHSLKLNETKVREILQSTETATDLATRYGVSADYISMIQRGVRWSHVEVEDMPERLLRRRRFGRHGEGHHGTTLTADAVLAIRSDPRTNQAIADAYGTSATTVSNIKNGKTWKALLHSA